MRNNLAKPVKTFWFIDPVKYSRVVKMVSTIAFQTDWVESLVDDGDYRWSDTKKTKKTQNKPCDIAAKVIR